MKSVNVLIASWIVIFTLYYLTVSIPPILPLIIKTFNIAHVAGGLIVGVPLLMIVILSMVGGWLGDRIGYRKVIGYAMISVSIGALLRGLADDYVVFLIATVILGAGMAVIYPNLPKMVRYSFAQNRIGMATGIYSTGIATGSMVAFLTTQLLVSYFADWRPYMLFLTSVSLFSSFVWWAIVPRTSHSSSTLSTSNSLVSIIRNRNVILTSFMVLLLNGIFYGLIGWMIPFLQLRGFGLIESSMLGGLLNGLEIPGLFILPYLSDRIFSSRAILSVFFTILGICSILVIFVGNLLLWVIAPLMGFIMGGLFSVLLALPARIVDKGDVGKAGGVILAVGYIGGILQPPLVGMLYDLTKTFNHSYIIHAAYAIASTLLALKLQLQRSNHRSH